MKRTLTLAAAALALLPAVAVSGGAAAQAAAPPPQAPWVFVTNFDGDYAEDTWRAYGDATDAQTLDTATGDNGCGTGLAGAYGALRSYDLDVTRKPPVTGAEKPLPVATWAGARFLFPVAGDGPVDVKVTWSARNVKDCENCTVAAYIDSSPARAGGDFDFVGELGRGWQQFGHKARVDLVDGNGLFVALGWMGGNATIGLDCITVEARPAQTAVGDEAPPAANDGAAPPPDGTTPPPPDDGTTPPPPVDTTRQRPPTNFYYDFEDGLAPWGFAGDATYGLLQRQYGENGCPDLQGNAFASISDMAGPLASPDPLDYDAIPIPVEPALYMMAPFRAAAGQVTRVQMNWASKSVEGCEDCTQLVYVGDDPHPRTTDFKRLGTFGKEWANRDFLFDLKAEPGSPIYIGLGFQAAGAERPIRLHNVGIDCLAVRIHQIDN